MATRTRKDTGAQTALPLKLDLQRILEALVDPVRRSIVRQLYERSGQISCGNFELAVAASTATHHFKVLRLAGLITQHYEGTSHMNILCRKEVDAAFPGLLDALLRA